jgi:ABC-type Fe3+-hydroxamate transport system substrate-binding protein
MPYALRAAPERIVCLTEEPTETLYLLGEERRIVGISAYTERPPEAKRDKPVVSAFISGSVSKIRALEPDLVIGFSDIQAELARELIQANLQVLIFNQRSVQEILDFILVLGRIVCAEARADQLVRGYVQRLAAAEERARARSHRPRVYFEEWDEPAISAIAWVSELIELAGTSSPTARGASWPRIASCNRPRWSSAHPRSTSHRGAVSRSMRARRWLGRASMLCLRCARGACTSSTPRSFCSRGQPASPTGSARSRRFCTLPHS